MPNNPLAPRWRKMLRDLRLHKMRTLLVVFAMTLGLFSAGALLDAWALVRRVTVESYLASHPAAATLRVENVVDANTLAQIQALPEIAAARVRGRAFAALQAHGARFSAELFALDDFGTRDIAALSGDRGEWPPKDGQIAIERSSLDFAGLTLGDEVALALGTTAQPLNVGGVARDIGLPPGWMDHVVYGFVTPATLATLGVTPTLNEVQFTLRDANADRATARRVAERVKAVLEENGVHVARVEVPVPREHPHAAQMDSLMLTQGAFGALTLLVVALLIVNLMAAMLTGQTREIAVMKSLGASPRQLAALYLGFAALLGAFAALVAVPLGALIGRPYAALQTDMLNFSVQGFAVPAWAFALQAAVGCLLPVLAALPPVLRACRRPTAASLRDAGIASDGAHVSRRIAVPGIGRPTMLSVANAFRRRQRLLLTVLALAAGGAVFVGAANLRAAIFASIDAMFAAQRYDVVVRFAEPRPAAALQAAAASVDGVRATQALLTDSAAVVHADGARGDAFTLLGLPPDTPLFRAHTLDGRWLAADDTHALVVSQRLLREEPQLTPGADVVLSVGGQRSTWRVVGADDTIVQSIAYAPFATLAELHGDERASSLAVALRDATPAAQLDAVVRLRGALDAQGMHVSSTQLVSETRRALQDHLLMVEQFLGAMAWVMIAVGGIGLASSMSLGVLERTREIGVMRAIGAARGAILRMVQAEGITIALLAWLVALPLSIPMTLALADAFGRVMFPIPAQWLPESRSALEWLALVLPVAFAACAWPAWRAARMPVAHALSYE